MPKFLTEILSLLIASLLSLAFVYFKIAINTLQQVVIVTLIILIILLDRTILSGAKQINVALRLFLLFLLSFSLQMLVFSSGGFFSPFLILFHLFAIAVSFLVNVKIATTFLILAISFLMIGTFIDPRLYTVFQEDIGSVALYVLSFIVILPLAQVVANRYHLKDALSKLLTKELNLIKIRQKSLLEGLSDIVIITNTNLKILSFNEAAERGLRLSSSELIDRYLFEVLTLKDLKGNVVDEHYLSIAQIVEDKTTHIIKNLLLHIRNTAVPRRVTIQVRPTVDLEGRIDQLAFIINESGAVEEASKGHQDLQQALLRHEAALEDLKNKLAYEGKIDLSRKAELLGRAEKDILTAIELQDHSLQPVIELKDVASVLSRVVSLETLFARVLGVTLLFSIDDKYIIEARKLIPQDSAYAPSAVTTPFFTAPVDIKWFDLLIQKLLDLSILLVTGTKYPQVQLLLSYDKEFVYISITATADMIGEEENRLIFTQYYGRLGMNTNLRLGSGLEGYMAKTVASLLGISLEVQIKNRSSLEFSLKISKKPPIQPS